jgi:hypothetical protein
MQDARYVSCVKVFTQTIIGRYLCPRSRAEIAEKARGGNKEKGKRKKSCQATHVPEALHYATEIVGGSMQNCQG